LSLQITKCFLCNSTTTYFSKSKNKFTWYNYNGTKICNLCYYKQYHKQVREGTFQSYKEKIGLRKCSRCGTDKTYTTITIRGYPHRKWVSDGNGGYICHNCTKKTLYQKREHEYTLKRLRTSNPRILWAQMSYRNHKRNNFIMNLTMHELEEMASKTNKCAICDVILVWGYLNGKLLKSTASLDRINNEKVITKNNIQILCYECNAIKRTKPMQEFIDYCKYVAKKFS
jgi:hypothetical protein